MLARTANTEHYIYTFTIQAYHFSNNIKVVLQVSIHADYRIAWHVQQTSQ